MDSLHSTLVVNTWPLLTSGSSSHKAVFLVVGDLKGFFDAHKNVGPSKHILPFFSSSAVAAREAISAGFSPDIT